MMFFGPSLAPKESEVSNMDFTIERISDDYLVLTLGVRNPVHVADSRADAYAWIHSELSDQRVSYSITELPDRKGK